MSQYYLRSTLRNARKNSVLSFAKLFGITLSFAVVLFATGFVYYETSFDKFIPDHDKIFRCLMTGKLNGNDADFAVTCWAMAETMKSDLAEVSDAVKLISRGEASFVFEDKRSREGELLYTDTNFFSFFGFPVEKTLEKPFEEKNHLVISHSIAINHFGSVEEALNKVVNFNDQKCIISGVFEDFPSNCHLQFDYIQWVENMRDYMRDWGSQSFATYVKTSTSNIDPENLGFKMTKSVYTHSETGIDGAGAETWEDLKWHEGTYLFYPAEPLKDAHFSNHRFDIAKTSNKTYVYGAIILAIMVLVISSINYLNLSIADLSTRMKEIGIHKTTGATKYQITIRFLYESLLFWFIGFILAILLYDLAIDPLMTYLDLELNLTTPIIIKLAILSLIAVILFNIATNIIPISLIANKKVLSLIKEDNSGKYFSVKSSLIFFQFVLSGLIILGSLIVKKQVDYMITRDRGYDTENIIAIRTWGIDDNTRRIFIDELKSLPTIACVSTSNEYLGYDPSMNSAYFEAEAEENYFHTSRFQVDHNFQETFDLDILEGRFFQKDRKSDFKTAVINEAAQQEYRKTGSLIGKKLLFNGNTYHIIGIVKDFNFRSLHHELLPLVFLLNENQGNIYIKTHANQTAEALNALDRKWAEFEIDHPLEYEFHDEVLKAHYSKDQQAKKLLLVLLVISISVACIGLYAISFFIIVRRTKEIGIRKVNGARSFDVVLMLNRDFIKWVCIAFGIAIPLSIYLMNKWLENFAYKTPLSWWIFALAGALALGIALLTLSWQSWRAATCNPVEALRYE